MHNGSTLCHEVKGRDVLLGLIAFFGVMVLADSIFLYYAVATFDGGDTTDPYRKGLHYNDTLAEAAEQDARGWHVQLRYDRVAGQLSMLLHDRTGQTLRGLIVASRLERPTTDKEDVALTLIESEEGVYSGRAQLANGQWIFIATIKDPVALVAPYRVKQRLFISEIP